MFSAFALAGVIEFLILDGVQDFPLLAIGLPAPAIIGAALLAGSGNPKLAPIGTLVLVFTPMLMSIANPQIYDPRTYLIDGSLANIATIILFIVLATVLPTSDDRKRGWMLRTLRVDFSRALQQTRPRHTPDEFAFRYADLVGQLGALQPAAPGGRAVDHLPDCAGPSSPWQPGACGPQSRIPLPNGPIAKDARRWRPRIRRRCEA